MTHAQPTLLQNIKRLSKHPLLTGTVLFTAGNLVAQGIGFLVLPIFTHFLSPDDYGIFNYTNSVNGILANLSLLSLNSFVLRQAFAVKNAHDQQQLFGTIFSFTSVLALVLLGLEFLIIPFALERLGIKIPFEPYFRIAIASNFLECFCVIPLVYFRVKRRVLPYFFLTSGQAILSAGLGILLVMHYKLGLMGRYYGIFFADIAFALVYIIMMLRLRAVSWNTKYLKAGLIFSLPLIPATFASMGTSTFDRFALERFVPLADLGVYSVGVTLGSALLILSRSFYRAVEPEIFAICDKPDFATRVVKLKNAVVIVMVCLGCGFILYTPEIVRIMLSPSFRGAQIIIPFFVVNSLFQSARIFSDTTIHAFRKTMYEPIISFSTLATTVALNLALIPTLGMLGAAIASTATAALMMFASCQITSRFSGIQWKAAKDALVILGAASLSFALSQIDVGQVWLNLALKAPIGVALLFIGYRFLPMLRTKTA